VNLVYVHQYFSTPRGATGTRSYDFARLLAERGHRVTVVTGVYGPSDLSRLPLPRLVNRRRIDGLDVRIINVRHDNRQTFWRRVAAYAAFMVVATAEVLRVRDADVVLATSTPLTIGLPGAAARFLRRVPFVFEVRDIWPDAAVEVGALRNPLLIAMARAMERFFYRAASRVVVVGERMGDRLRRRLGRRADAVRVIPLGADVARFARAEPDTAWLRAHGLEGRFVVLYTGAHGRANALNQVLEAAARLRDAPQVRFVLIGDGALKNDLRAQAAREGLANVLFLDPVPKDRLPGILRAGHLGLVTVLDLPIYETAITNKFMEYLAAGLPALVNKPGSEAAEVCRREGCGVVVPPGDPEAMAEAIRRLAADPARAAEMGRRAREVAVRRFDRRRLVLDLERVLREAAGRP